ncbi:MAG TPA: hypothetical protein VF144_07200 [Chitinophagaceae bacterium]
MKKIFFINALIFFTGLSFGQEALKIQSGGSLTIQTGAELVLQGGLTLENGSSLLNNGTVSLKNNIVSNISNWTDQSILGALSGNGIVIFNSTHPQQFTGPTNFYTVYINTDQLTINNDATISNLLRLINGRINTTNYVLALINAAASALENDITNPNYANSWINGNFRRSITTNINSYDFPVGNSERSNLLKFLNNNITGPSSLTSSFGTKQGTDAGLNVVENGNIYTAVNEGGVWKLVPDADASGGNYALHLYFNGFTGLTDNSFGILRRPDASVNAADWTVPTGSLLEPINGSGRKVSDGFARRFNLTSFSQLGIGSFTSTSGTPECSISGPSEICIASVENLYAAPPGMTSYLWSVTGAAGIVGPDNGPIVNIGAATSPGSFTLNLTITLNGLSAQCSRTILVGANTVCNITGANELCAESINNIYLGPQNLITYSWSVTPGLSIVGPNNGPVVNVTGVTPGVQILTLNATGPSGCVSQCIKPVFVKPLPPCDITGLSNLTSGTSNNDYTAPANMSSYSWSIAGNGSIVGSTSGSSVNVTAGAAGSFTLTLTTTLNGCSITCNKVVTVDPIVTYNCNISGETEVCGNATHVFTAPANLTSYQWIIAGEGMILGPTNNSSVTVDAAMSGSYTLTLETTVNGLQCSSQKTVTVIECVSACTYTQGFYHNPKASSCYNNSGASLSSSDHMLAAFGITSSQVFGNVANKRFFKLYRTDITNGTIFKMLPGGSSPKSIDIDNKIPFDGAYYDDPTTWSLVPIQPTGPQKGKIRNIFLAQTITLWFNIRNSSNLGSISLADDTLVTKATVGCGSNTPIGEATGFGLPHNIIVYLNGNNGYPATINGLFTLANDVLGGVVTNISASSINQAVEVVNNAFDECRVLVGTISYNNNLTRISPVIVDVSKIRAREIVAQNELKVIASPNPYKDRFQLLLTSPVSGPAKIEFFTMEGKKVFEMSKTVLENTNVVMQYPGPTNFTALAYKVSIGKHIATGIVLKPN